MNSSEVWNKDKLIELMKEYEVSGFELSRNIGIPHSTLNKIILGNTEDPRISTINALAKYFNIPIEELLFDNSNERNIAKKKSFIPIIEFNKLNTFLNKELHIHEIYKCIYVEIDSNQHNLFAIETPSFLSSRFRENSVLILDKNSKVVKDSFVLVKTKNIMICKIDIDDNGVYFIDYSQAKPQKIPYTLNIKILGNVIRSIIPE